MDGKSKGASTKVEKQAELMTVFVALAKGRQGATAGSSWYVRLVDGSAAGIFTEGQPACPPATAGLAAV